MDEEPTQGGPAAFSEALSDAIAQRGVSLAWLRGRLTHLGTPLSVATLSYWRSGRSQPEHQTSLHALDTLEEILHLPRGHLTSRLGPSRRAHPVKSSASLADVMGNSTAVRRALSRLGYDPDDPETMIETSTHVTHDVSAGGQVRSASVRSTWLAVRDGAAGRPFLLEIGGRLAAEPEFVALRGCSIGRTCSDLDAGLFGVELRLDSPLALGETAITEHEVRGPVDPDGAPMYERHLTRRLSQTLIWVRFEDERLPVDCEAYTEDTVSGEVLVHPLPSARSAHHIVRNFGPGKVGIRWRW